MPFWSSQRIELENGRGELVTPFKKENIKHGQYDLTLSRQVLVTPDSEESSSSTSYDEKSPTLRIPPGQFAILYTNESVQIPENVIGFINISTKEKWKGLINVSGFHVTPGFKGRLKFTVYNAGNKQIHLEYDEAYFMIWFAEFDSKVRDPYNGIFAGQDKITAADREQMSDGRHSPDSLHLRLKKLEEQINTMHAVGILIIVPTLIGLAVAVFEHWFKGENSNLAHGNEQPDLFVTIALVTLLANFFAAFLILLCTNREFRRFVIKWMQDQKGGC